MKLKSSVLFMLMQISMSLFADAAVCPNFSGKYTLDMKSCIENGQNIGFREFSVLQFPAEINNSVTLVYDISDKNSKGSTLSISQVGCEKITFNTNNGEVPLEFRELTDKVNGLKIKQSKIKMNDQKVLMKIKESQKTPYLAESSSTQLELSKNVDGSIRFNNKTVTWSRYYVIPIREKFSLSCTLSPVIKN